MKGYRDLDYCDDIDFVLLRAKNYFVVDDDEKEKIRTELKELMYSLSDWNAKKVYNAFCEICGVIFKYSAEVMHLKDECYIKQLQTSIQKYELEKEIYHEKK